MRIFFFFIVILRSFTLVKHRISKTKPKLSQNIYIYIFPNKILHLKRRVPSFEIRDNDNAITI